MVFPNLLRICSSNPGKPADRMQLCGRGQHHGANPVGLGSGVRGEVQRRVGVAVQAPANADAQQHRHDEGDGQQAHPLTFGDFGGDSTAGRSRLLSVWRSATRAFRSPSVTALVAALTRSRCSSIESSPSFKAASRILQASCRSLSLARVSAVAPPENGAPSHFATWMIVEARLRFGAERDGSYRRRSRNSFGCVSVVRMATYSGGRATAATGGGLRASAALTAGRGVLGPHRCVGGM